MSNLIKLDLDLGTLEQHQKEALNKLVMALNHSMVEEYHNDVTIIGAEVMHEQKETVPEEKPKKTRAPRAVKTETTSEAFEDKERTESDVDKYEAAKEIETEVEEEAPAASGETLTLDDLRALVTADVLDKHRKALKEKIVELGGTKLADLSSSTYAAMHKFIKELK